MQVVLICLGDLLDVPCNANGQGSVNNNNSLYLAIVNQRQRSTDRINSLIAYYLVSLLTLEGRPHGIGGIFGKFVKHLRPVAGGQILSLSCHLCNGQHTVSLVIINSLRNDYGLLDRGLELRREEPVYVTGTKLCGHHKKQNDRDRYKDQEDANYLCLEPGADNPAPALKHKAKDISDNKINEPEKGQQIHVHQEEEEQVRDKGEFLKSRKEHACRSSACHIEQRERYYYSALLASANKPLFKRQLFGHCSSPSTKVSLSASTLNSASGMKNSTFFMNLGMRLIRLSTVVTT